MEETGSDSRKREETNTFPAIRGPPGGITQATNGYGSRTNLNPLAGVPEEMWEDGKDSLRACAPYRKNAPRVGSTIDGSLISV